MRMLFVVVVIFLGVGCDKRVREARLGPDPALKSPAGAVAQAPADCDVSR